MSTTTPPTTRPADETPAAAVAEDGISPDTLFELPSCDNRERALPVRQQDLNRLLLAEPGLHPEDRDRLTALGRFLGAMLHSEFYDKLRALKEHYAPLDPDSDYVPLRGHTRERGEHSDEEFLAHFEEILERANYRPLDLQVVADAVTAPNEMGLNYVPNFELFEHLRVYVRGYMRITRDRRTLHSRFRKQTVHLDAYQRLIVVLKFKPGLKLGPLACSDYIYLRMFKDVPHVDMEMHLPEQGSRPTMRRIDLAQIASPFMISIPTLLLKVFTAAITSPWLAAPLVFGPISAGVNSFFGFQRAKQRHLATMIHGLYYKTLANNACVLTRVIDSAEDEEYKESALAYFFLWRARDEERAPTIAALDDRIEAYLRQHTGIEINFEVADALQKLYRLGLAYRDSQGGLHATPLDEALRKLDRQWDDRFRYSAP